MIRLLGPHVNSLAGGIPELIAAWQPPLVVTLVRDTIWNWVKQVSPQTIIVLRAFDGDEPGPDLGDPALDPVAAGRALALRAVANCSGIRADYLQITNEPAIPSREALSCLAAFEQAALETAAQAGRRLAIGNFSVGNPSDLDWWETYYPALRDGALYGAVLNLHEYNWPHLFTLDEEWYTLRHQQVYRRLPPLLQLPLILGEVGLDAGARGPVPVPSGWNGHVSGSDYLAELESYDAEIVGDPYVIGAAVFCCNAPDRWWSFNIWPDLAPRLAQAAQPLYRKPVIARPVLAPRPWGIDVSWWQSASIDWRRVKEAGCGFAILRASCGASPDATYEGNWVGAGKARIRRGAYHYVTAGDHPRGQARVFEYCLRRGRPDDPSLVYADLEDKGLTDDACRAFVEEFEDRRETPCGIYTSYSKARAIGLGAWAGSHRLWVAHWTTRPVPLLPAPWQSWSLWQHTNKGQVNGIPGRVDLNWISERGEL